MPYSGHSGLDIGKVTLHSFDMVAQSLQRYSMLDKALVSRAVFHQDEQQAVIPRGQIPFLRQDITIFEKKARPRRMKYVGGRRGQGSLHFLKER